MPRDALDDLAVRASLTTEADILSLRLAPADGSAPVDGTGDGAVVREGNPFYFDWLAGDRLFASFKIRE